MYTFIILIILECLIISEVETVMVWILFICIFIQSKLTHAADIVLWCSFPDLKDVFLNFTLCVVPISTFPSISYIFPLVLTGTYREWGLLLLSVFRKQEHDGWIRALPNVTLIIIKFRNEDLELLLAKMFLSIAPPSAFPFVPIDKVSDSISNFRNEIIIFL